MTVQQRLTTPLGSQLRNGVVRGRTRRAFVRAVVRDIAFGVQSLGELDFARLCRSRGLPEPSRQVVRQTPGGRIYLDVGWDDVDLVVEIDGAQHRWAWRSPKTTCDRTTSLSRALRDRFIDQVERGHQVPLSTPR